jgi:uncharacterized protein
MQCPKCTAGMETVKFRGVTIDRCTRCRGIFCDAAEELKLRHFRGAAALDIGNAEFGREMDEKPSAACPRCGVLMRRVADSVHHLTLEVCGVCKGVFFDAGEFREFKFCGDEEYYRELFGEAGTKEGP